MGVRGRRWAVAENVTQERLQRGSARGAVPAGSGMCSVSNSGPHQTESQRQSPGASRGGAAEAPPGLQIHRVHRVGQQEPLRRLAGRVRAPVHQEQQDRGHGQHRRGRGVGHLQLSEILLQLPCFLVRRPAGAAPSSAEAHGNPAHQHAAQVSRTAVCLLCFPPTGFFSL